LSGSLVVQAASLHSSNVPVDISAAGAISNMNAKFMEGFGPVSANVESVGMIASSPAAMSA
jgi:hypothetical protein